eukprot:410235_1
MSESGCTMRTDQLTLNMHPKYTEMNKMDKPNDDIVCRLLLYIPQSAPIFTHQEITKFYQIRKGTKERKVHRNALSHGLSGRLRGVEYTYLFHDKCRDQGKREYMEMYTSTSRGKNEEVLRVFYYKKKNKKYTEYMMIDKEQLSDYVAYKRETKPKWNAGHLEYGTRVFWKYSKKRNDMMKDECDAKEEQIESEHAPPHKKQKPTKTTFYNCNFSNCTF